MNSRKPVISVVMGVYNGEPYLSTAIDSILMQEGVDFEFVIVDDGSTDRTPEILADAESRDPRVRVIRQEKAGLTRALVRGCADARGRYIARQDSDDVSLPDRLRMQAEMLEADPSLVLVSCWCDVIGPEDELLLTYRWPSTPSEATEMLVRARRGPIHGSVMFRRDAYDHVGGYRPLFYFAQDSDLWLRLATVGTLNYVQSVLFRHRISPNSISGRMHPLKVPYARLIDKLHAARQRGEDEKSILERFVPPERRRSGRSDSADATHYFIACCLMRQRDPRARSYLRQCLRANPLNFRAWCLLPFVELAVAFWSRRVRGSG